MSDIYPQLWLKQIPNFIIAYHDGFGLFNDIRVQNVTHEVQSWADENSEGIKRFAALLNEICKVARDHKGELLEVYCPGPDRVEVRRQHGEGMRTLPQDLSQRWAADGGTRGLGRSDSLIGGGSENESDGDTGGVYVDDDSDAEPDYTACSSEDCGYCGRCSY